MGEPYRRRIGVTSRRGVPNGRVGRSIVLDGGHDAPLTRRGRAVYVWAIALVAVVGFALILWSRT